MSFFGSLLTAKVKGLHDSAIKTVASWDPDAAGESQIEEWSTQARDMAQSAAHAATEAVSAKNKVVEIRSNISRYTQAAAKLAQTNESAANQAADAALSLTSQLSEAISQETEAVSWSAETLAAAEKAQQIVMTGRAKIESAKHDLSRATQESKMADQRRKDRERMSGITTNLSGTDIALDALAANTAKLREKTAADNIRSNVLGKSVDANAAINAALAEVDSGPKPKTLAEKMAALQQG